MANWNLEVDRMFVTEHEPAPAPLTVSDDMEEGMEEAAPAPLIIEKQDVEEGMGEASKFFPLPAGLQSQEVLNNLTCLSECIVRTTFKASSKDKSWNRFHEKVKEIRIPYLNVRLSRYLCLCIFEACLRRLWPEANIFQELLDSNVTDDDYDVISYIAGSVLSKLRRHASGDPLRLINSLTCTSEDAAHATLTEIKDRGGLTYIGEGTFNLFKKAEGFFKSSNPNEKVPFISQCKALLAEDFYALVEEEYSDSVIEGVLDGIISKFFKIRINHRGKVLMQKAKDGRVRQKSLRTTLKK